MKKSKLTNKSPIHDNLMDIKLSFMINCHYYLVKSEKMQGWASECCGVGDSLKCKLKTKVFEVSSFQSSTFSNCQSLKVQRFRKSISYGSIEVDPTSHFSRTYKTDLQELSVPVFSQRFATLDLWNCEVVKQYYFQT